VTCNDPISLETLVAYWLGEVPELAEAALEEHLFACAHCSRWLEQLVALAGGVRAAVEHGRVSLVVSGPFVQAMKQAGLRLREYRVEPGGSVACTIRADDGAVISRLRAPLAGVARLDLVRLRGSGGPEARFADVPFDAAAGEVLVIPPAAWLKTMPAFTMRMRLIDVRDQGESPLGEYTFIHSPG
jgi:anti-sigma factor RsiW